MVRRARKFTPQVLLSAPRRSAAVPNATGTKVLYTVSSYSFAAHEEHTELRVLDLTNGESAQLAHNNEISSLHWLDEDQFVSLHAKKDGRTEVVVGSVSAMLETEELGRSHYVAGTIGTEAGNLKIARLGTNSEKFAVVLSAQANKDGSLSITEHAGHTRRSSGRLYSGLPVRHWSRYETKQKNALWYGELSLIDGMYSLSTLHNALKGSGLESPIRPFGGTDNFDVRHDSIIFVAKDPNLNQALNSKCNVYLLFMDSWTQNHPPQPQVVVVPGYKGGKTSPIFERNGDKAAFLSLRKAGYEADQSHIFVIPDVNRKQLTASKISVNDTENDRRWDFSPGAIAFSVDGSSIIANAEENGSGKLFLISGISGVSRASRLKALTTSGSVSDFKPLISGNIFVSGTSLVDDSLYFVVDPNREPDEFVIWSHSNSSSGSKFGLNHTQISSIWTPANNPKVNKQIHSFVIRPSSFSKDKKYPVAYLIHGGPHGAWTDNWSTRWNPLIFAEQGYIVVAPNPTGSTGYGQAFTDAIKMNWGGDPYEDIVKIFEWVSENLPEADNENAVALGASYGGYMINWIQGHDLGRKFKALVCHDGIFSSSGLLATDELYFAFDELGSTSWYDPGFVVDGKRNTAMHESEAAQSRPHSSTSPEWRKWDPSEHLDKWDTSQLVIHSERDYRIPISEGLSTFNVLQARGVESQFLTFPDESHWVLKPENALVWHKVVLNWINKHTGLPAFTEEDPDGDVFWGDVESKGREWSDDSPTQDKVEMLDWVVVE